MVRSFIQEPIEHNKIEEFLKLALKAPSAGNSCGTSFLAIDETESLKKFWDISLPQSRRKNFSWQQLLNAPVIVLALADPTLYINRYSESDKKSKTISGRNPKEWKVPFWFVDAGFAIENLLLAVHAQGLGALFFAIFSSEQEIKTQFKIPDQVEIVGAIAIGHIDEENERPSKSLLRKKPKLEEVIHFNVFNNISNNE